MIAKSCKMIVFTTHFPLPPSHTKRSLIVSPIIGVGGAAGVQEGDRRAMEI